MAYRTLQRQLVALLVILNSQSQLISCQIQRKMPTSTPTETGSQSATEKSGINLSDSFFIHRLRQGNSSALNDFNSLRQTLVIPEDHQKHITDFWQQQNPLNRFRLWNTMQNMFIHGYPNSHALNRMGLPIGNVAEGQQMIPAQQFLNILQQARGRNQQSGVNELMPEMNASTASKGQDVFLKAINTKPITSETMVTAPFRSQINPNVQLPATQSQLGQLGLDQIRNVLRTRVNKNALDDTMSLIEQVLKNTAASQSGTNIGHNTFRNNAKTINANNNAGMINANNNAGMMQTSMDGASNGYILQYVGDIFSPDFVNSYDMSPRPSGFTETEIGSMQNSPEPIANGVQNTIQFVGNIFGNNGLQSISDVPAIRGTGNEMMKSTALDQSVAAHYDSANMIGNNMRTNVDSNMFKSPDAVSNDVFLQYVGDLTGADLIGTGNEIVSLTGELNPRVTKLFSDSLSVGMRGNIITSNINAVSPEVAEVGLVKQTPENIRNEDVTQLANRDWYLQKVGNLLADQLTPIDGSLIAFNETNTKRFMQNTSMIQRPMVPVQFSRQTWPFGRRSFTQQMVANNLIGNRALFQHRSNMNLAQILNRQQQRFRVSPRWSPIIMNSVSGESKNLNLAQLTNQDRNSEEDTKAPSVDRSGEPDIATIVKLLRSLTNKIDGGSAKTNQPNVTGNRHSHVTHSTQSSSNFMPVKDGDFNTNKVNFPGVMGGQTRGMGNDGVNQFGRFQNNGQLVNSAQTHSNPVRISSLINGLADNTRDMGSSSTNLLPRIGNTGQFSRNWNRNIFHERANSNFQNMQMMPIISSAKAFQAMLRTNANNDFSGAQTEAIEQTVGRDNVVQERHRNSVMHNNTATSSSRSGRLQFNGENKTLTDQSDEKKPPRPKTGIETGFILVNRLFVTDNIKDSIDTAKNNGLKGSEIKTVIRRNEIDPRTGETVNIIFGVRPSENTNKHTERRQAVNSTC